MCVCVFNCSLFNITHNVFGHAHTACYEIHTYIVQLQVNGIYIQMMFLISCIVWFVWGLAKKYAYLNCKKAANDGQLKIIIALPPRWIQWISYMIHLYDFIDFVCMKCQCNAMQLLALRINFRSYRINLEFN